MLEIILVNQLKDFVQSLMVASLQLEPDRNNALLIVEKVKDKQ